jgi:hypothetical protein
MKTKIKNWYINKKLQFKKWLREKKKQFMKSRFLLGTLLLTIGITYTSAYYEIQKLDIKREIIVSQSEVGVMGSPVAHASVEEIKIEEENIKDVSTPQIPLNSVKEIVNKVHRLESSAGKNNFSKCEVQGKYNEYGYGVHGENYLCFEKGKDREAVEKWFEKELKDKTLAKALCKYNTGQAADDCQYYKNYLSI